MLLAIDVGNTNITFGYFAGKKLKKEVRIDTQVFKRVPKFAWSRIDKVVVSSVVPPINKKLKEQIKKPLKFITAANIPAIKVKIRNKKEVGSDRLVNAFAAYELYQRPLIIIDFGTATTFCAVNEQGEYLGGVIAPGINLSRHVLHEKTAKLPLIELARPGKVIGDSTLSAMRSGLVLGYASLVEGVVALMKKELSRKYKQKNVMVIATGGYTPLINQFLEQKLRYDSQLTLKGLQLIANKIF